jgi:hypothetical protein
MIADYYQVVSNSENPTAVLADSGSYFVFGAICFFTRYQQYATNRRHIVPVVHFLTQSVLLPHFGKFDLLLNHVNEGAGKV